MDMEMFFLKWCRQYTENSNVMLQQFKTENACMHTHTHKQADEHDEVALTLASFYI